MADASFLCKPHWPYIVLHHNSMYSEKEILPAVRSPNEITQGQIPYIKHLPKI